MTEPFDPISLFVQMQSSTCDFLHAYEGNKWRPLPETVEIETQSATNHDIDFEIRVDEHSLVELPCGSRPWWFRVERVGKNGSRSTIVDKRVTGRQSSSSKITIIDEYVEYIVSVAFVEDDWHELTVRLATLGAPNPSPGSPAAIKKIKVPPSKPTTSTPN